MRFTTKRKIALLVGSLIWGLVIMLLVQAILFLFNAAGYLWVVGFILGIFLFRSIWRSFVDLGDRFSQVEGVCVEDAIHDLLSLRKPLKNCSTEFLLIWFDDVEQKLYHARRFLYRALNATTEEQVVLTSREVLKIVLSKPQRFETINQLLLKIYGIALNVGEAACPRCKQIVTAIQQFLQDREISKNGGDNTV